MNKILFTGMFLLIFALSFAQTRVEAESYTAMNGVSVESGWGDGGAQNIYPMDQGDWVEYAINPAVTGVHTFVFRIGTITTGAQLKVKKADGTVLATVDLPNTGDYQWFLIAAAHLPLTAGEQTIRIESTASSKWTMNWFEYSFGYKLEAELYSNMNGIATANAGDVGGGLCVGYIDANEWMDYPVNIATAGTYSVKLRFAATWDNVQMQIKNSGGTVLTTVNVPNTNGWENWTTVDASLALPAGQQTLRIYAVNPGWNINWWTLLPPSNISPVANAGTNQMIATNTVTLTGSGSDPDGTVSGYSWVKLSGPSGSSIGTATAAATTVTGLVAGTYVFRLTVTDNGGATGTADVTVNVISGLWGTTGNSNIDESLHFIGTTNSQPLVFKAGGHSWAKLTTDGTFMANKIKVLANGWADYVFDTTYKLRPLLDVERFIKLHKHLPDVPSEKEVLSEGLDVGDNQAVLLKKIEELTLYIIDINKKIEKLSEENAELKKKLESKN